MSATIKVKIEPRPVRRRRPTCGRCGEEGHNRRTCETENPEPQAPRWRRYMDRNRADGLCMKCSAPAYMGGLCDEHHAKMLAGKKVDRTGASAMERRRAANRRRYRERAEKGLCKMCGVNPPSPSLLHCEGCLSKQRERSRTYLEAIR